VEQLYDQYQSTKGKPIRDQHKYNGGKPKLEIKPEEKDEETKEPVDDEVKVDLKKESLNSEHKSVVVKKGQADVNKESGRPR